MSFQDDLALPRGGRRWFADVKAPGVPAALRKMVRQAVPRRPPRCRWWKGFCCWAPGEVVDGSWCFFCIFWFFLIVLKGGRFVVVVVGMNMYECCAILVGGGLLWKRYISLFEICVYVFFWHWLLKYWEEGSETNGWSFKRILNSGFFCAWKILVFNLSPDQVVTGDVFLFQSATKVGEILLMEELRPTNWDV